MILKFCDKKGINLVSLMCLIAIMIIIISTVGFSFNNISIKTKKKEFANEIYTIQKMVDEYYFKNNEYPIKDTSTNEIDLYELGVNEVNRGLKKDGDETDIYVVDKANGKVTYKKGVNIKGKIYDSLADTSNAGNLELKEK